MHHHVGGTRLTAGIFGCIVGVLGKKKGPAPMWCGLRGAKTEGVDIMADTHLSVNASPAILEPLPDYCPGYEITDDMIYWGRIVDFLIPCVEHALRNKIYYFYANDCLFDLSELRWDFREDGNLYDYTIWKRKRGWLHSAYQYHGRRLYAHCPWAEDWEAVELLFENPEV